MAGQASPPRKDGTLTSAGATARVKGEARVASRRVKGEAAGAAPTSTRARRAPRAARAAGSSSRRRTAPAR